MLRRTLVPSALFVWWVTALLHAHPVSVAFAEVNVEGRQIHWRLHIPAVDMDTFFNIENLSSAQPRVTQYFATKVKVAQDGRDLPAMFSPLQIWKDPDGNPYVETTADFALPETGVQHPTLTCDLLRELTPNYKTVAFITVEGRAEQWVFENGGTYETSFAEPGHPFAAFALFARMGVLHMFTGYDHIAFLLGVVLMGGSFRAIVKIVTSFTIAHSITLALAAPNIVNVP